MREVTVVFIDSDLHNYDIDGDEYEDSIRHWLEGVDDIHVISIETEEV